METQQTLLDDELGCEHTNGLAQIIMAHGDDQGVGPAAALGTHSGGDRADLSKRTRSEARSWRRSRKSKPC